LLLLLLFFSFCLSHADEVQMFNSLNITSRSGVAANGIKLSTIPNTSADTGRRHTAIELQQIVVVFGHGD